MSEGAVFVSGSEIATYKRCRRKWNQQYVQRLVPIDEEMTGVRKLGSRVHQSLMELYAPDGTLDSAIDVLHTEGKNDLLAVTGDDVAFRKLNDDVELARIMVEGYWQWAAEEGIDQDLEVIGREIAIDTQLFAAGEITPHEIRLRGKLDQIIRRRSDNAILLRDFKTAANFADLLGMLSRDEQMPTYLMLAHDRPDAWGLEAGARVEGALYTMLRRVKRTKAATPPFYRQETVRYGAARLAEQRTRTRQVVSEMMHYRSLTDSAWAYPTPDRSCAWSCPWVSCCAMFDDGSDIKNFIAMNFQPGDPDARYAMTDDSGD